jgi:hypothetical protein
MPAFVCKADIDATLPNVCWHKTDILIALANVRFWVNSGHQWPAIRCLLLTQSRHNPRREARAITGNVERMVEGQCGACDALL